MEKNEKTKKPAWVESVEQEFSPIVQSLVGNLAGNCIQSFCHVAGLSHRLALDVLEECNRILNQEFPKMVERDD